MRPVIAWERAFWFVGNNHSEVGSSCSLAWVGLGLPLLQCRLPSFRLSQRDMALTRKWFLHQRLEVCAHSIKSLQHEDKICLNSSCFASMDGLTCRFAIANNGRHKTLWGRIVHVANCSRFVPLWLKMHDHQSSSAWSRNDKCRRIWWSKLQSRICIDHMSELTDRSQSNGVTWSVTW